MFQGEVADMATNFEANSYAVLMTMTAPGVLSDLLRERILAYLDTAPDDVKSEGRRRYVEYTKEW